MALFLPTIAIDGVTSITPEILQKMGVKLLLLDVDNTLAEPESQIPFLGTVEWSRKMTDHGFSILIMSNNFEKRVAPFAALYNLPFQSFSLKPLPAGYRRAARRFHVKCSQTAIVGDQVFTDIMGANLCGMKSILVTPVRAETSLTFRIRRRMEQPIRDKLKQNSQP